MLQKVKKKWPHHRGHRVHKGYTGKRLALIESGELHQVVVGNSFDRVSSLAPGTQATGDDEHLESKLL